MRDRLTALEQQIVAFGAQGCEQPEIGDRLSREQGSGRQPTVKYLELVRVAGETATFTEVAGAAPGGWPSGQLRVEPGDACG